MIFNLFVGGLLDPSTSSSSSSFVATGVDANPDPPPLFFLFFDDPPFEPSDFVPVPLPLPLLKADERPPCDDVGVGACEGVVCADDGAGESYSEENKSTSNIL